MRCLSCVWIVCLLVGCRSQAVPVTNPFMAPAVVPAPATRAPAPGTAAPYYPGDAIPGAAPTGTPAPVTPSASPYGTPPATYGTPPVAPPPATNPPGGWNSYPPVSQSPNNSVRPVSAALAASQSESVRVPTDDQSLRFAPQHTELEPSAPASPTPVVPDASVAPVQFVNQHTPTADQRPVVLREINSQQADQYQSQPTSHDGFRPQGSSRNAREQNRFSTPVESSMQEPASAAPKKEVADRFGFDPQYSWLRGQLEQSPATGQWQLRYVPLQGPVDQYGGRISIANPQVLGNLQNGDFVAIQGQLQMVQLGVGANVPTYTISVLQRQQFEAR